MKAAIPILFFVFCVGCGSIHHQPQAEATVQAQFVSLPKVPVEGVDYTQGITCSGAESVAVVYFRRFVAGCGMPDAPQDRGEFWCVQLWGGYAGVDYGQLWLAKDGSKILLQPPAKGLKSPTKTMLQRQGIRYD